MLWVADIIEPDSPFNQGADHEKFCKYYAQFSHNNLPPDNMIDFRKEAKALRKKVI